MIDSKKMARTAQRLVVETKAGKGSPPAYEGKWQVVWGGKVDRIEINAAGTPSTAIIWFPDLRWHQSNGVLWGDMIRIRTNEYRTNDRTILFSGFVTNYLSSFSGGSNQQGSSFERNAVLCKDYRWLLSVTSTIFGQYARGPDDYTNFGEPTQSAIADSARWLSGRRVIFNENGKGNRDAEPWMVNGSCQMPIFADPNNAEDWTALDMVTFILSPQNNQAYNYLPIIDPTEIQGLDHSDWQKVLNHVVIDGLNVLEALELICRHLGWSFREQYSIYGVGVNFVFFKVSAASDYDRDDNPTILHQLYAPQVGENISYAVAAGKKILWSMELSEDIAMVINNPFGFGSPHRFEFTAELVPAWIDTDFAPDAENLYFTEAELQDITTPNNYAYYKYYHPRGSSFRRDVGRKWALNESGRYTLSTSYNRGKPFDFETVIPAEYILDSGGKRNYAPFARQLLACLTRDKNSLNSIGIIVEFSFDAGVTWQILPASISSLKDECGIYISEANLAELVDEAEAVIEGGDLDGVQLNYYSSLADDKLNSRPFNDENDACQWKTRCRVTASVQMDQRLQLQAAPTTSSGSPFLHAQLYDFSGKYGLIKRTESSIFKTSDLPAWQVDSTTRLDTHLSAIRSANEDMSISGLFVLERLWLGDGAGSPDFAVGDCIEGITGRGYELSASFGGGKVWPEIIQIVYIPDKQQMHLVTRDLRFARELLE